MVVIPPGYNRDYSRSFRIHHYHESFYNIHGKILYHFGPKGVGKSICGRATIFNYLHFKLLKGNRKVFFPAIFFDLKIWNKNWKDKKLLLNVLKYELMNIFESFEEWQNYFLEYEKEFDKNEFSSVFAIIDNIIESFYQKKNSPLLIVLDHYSSIYDKNNEYENMKKNVWSKRNMIYMLYMKLIQ